MLDFHNGPIFCDQCAVVNPVFTDIEHCFALDTAILSYLTETNVLTHDSCDPNNVPSHTTLLC